MLGLQGNGVQLLECDLADVRSIDICCAGLRMAAGYWDALVMCPGVMEPIGPFAELDQDKWAQSVTVNFVNQLRVIHGLLPTRNTGSDLGPLVVLFAGGGTNGAPTSYSAYTISKIALIKMTELLDAELPDTRFVIIGPGWVNTKIHNETLFAGNRSGDAYERTLEIIENDEFTEMSRVLDCLDWLNSMPRTVIGGRNFSVAHDQWGRVALEEALKDDSSLYKLRRNGNNDLVPEKKK